MTIRSGLTKVKVMDAHRRPDTRRRSGGNTSRRRPSFGVAAFGAHQNKQARVEGADGVTVDLDASLLHALQNAGMRPVCRSLRAAIYLASDTATVGRFSRVHWCMEPS